MGAGKTSVGKKLAQILQRPFIDLDEVVENRAKLPIATLFARFGEAAFRKLETECLQQISREPASVVATGGGILLVPQNRTILRETGISVYLKWSLSVLYQRIKNSTHRPLLKEVEPAMLKDHLDGIFKKRAALYEQAQYVVAGNASTTLDQTVAMIIKKLPSELLGDS